MAKNPVDDAECRRCDDSGLVGAPGRGWTPCTCRSGAVVLEQRAQAGR